MKNDDFAVPATGAITMPTAAVHPAAGHGRSIATRDPSIIRSWAARHAAEPATGEATESGPATVMVNDGGAGIRFNFPAAGRFRPISWDEWLAHLERHHLVFVYEEEVSDLAYALSRERGSGGDAREDWLEAERRLHRQRPEAGARYWFVQQPPDAGV